MIMSPTPDSTMFSEIGYDPERQTLAVRYRGGGKLFHHEGVPPQLWTEMQEAESVGKFFHAHVKHKYPGVEIKEPPEDWQRMADAGRAPDKVEILSDPVGFPANTTRVMPENANIGIHPDARIPPVVPAEDLPVAPMQLEEW